MYLVPSIITYYDLVMCVERSDGKTDIRISKSWEGNTVKRNKSREINYVVCTVSYANIVRRNILPDYSIYTHNLKNI